MPLRGGTTPTPPVHILFVKPVKSSRVNLYTGWLTKIIIPLVRLKTMSIVSRLRTWLATALLMVAIALLFWLTPSLPAEALLCHTATGHQFCVLKIKRSAKNFWEYRVTLSKDGVTQPLTVYNCRDRIRSPIDKLPSDFDPNDEGEWICSFFQRTRSLPGEPIPQVL